MANSKSNEQIALKPQDLVVLLRLSLEAESMPTYAALGLELGLAASKVHASLVRAQQAQLVFKDADGKPRLVREALRQFVLFGARYAFPAVRGEVTRGLPTLYAASPIKEKILAPSELPPVWPDKNGTVRGMALYPLYPNVPYAAQGNPALYELLVLFDALRAGSARERTLAQDLLNERLSA
ncbi:MAG: hypothetical protein Q8N02_02845 [Methylotenera sp.]|nr:hypothetical protein [Methylotenera sp.]MDP1597480.1 hypothetical protein [Methylotenera sp.]MDP1755248.1 hypothetical protein [Methylotenera sp.]MDP1959951.1 hypothetical protein [Methylotenera sp.]MDP2102471.1 hypothetical protein [Methylotenera sp.]